MYTYDQIKAVHLELTERCQAACPMCPRTGNEHLSEAELSLHDIKKIFPPEFIKQLDRISLCGNFGEPIVARDCLNIVKYFRSNNSEMLITMNTNAGARPVDWWTDLANTIGKRGFVIFGIDGLEDTNHVYRVNVRWDNIINGAKAFIAAGGEARWDYIVFQHNEHQIEQAQELSKQLGFKSFRLKKSYRYINNPKTDIKEPLMYKNEAALKLPKTKEFYDTAPIDCKVKKINEIFISAEGLMLPCCWVAGKMYDYDLVNYKDDQVWSAIGDKSLIDCKIYGIKGAMESGLLQRIEQSWTKKSVEEGKLKICTRMCNVDFDLFRSQYK